MAIKKASDGLLQGWRCACDVGMAQADPADDRAGHWRPAAPEMVSERLAAAVAIWGCGAPRALTGAGFT